MGIYGTGLNAIPAYQTLTISGVTADGQTATIGPQTYEFDTDSLASLKAGDEINIQAEKFNTDNKGWFTITAVGVEIIEKEPKKSRIKRKWSIMSRMRKAKESLKQFWKSLPWKYRLQPIFRHVTLAPLIASIDAMAEAHSERAGCGTYIQ